MGQVKCWVRKKWVTVGLSSSSSQMPKQTNLTLRRGRKDWAFEPTELRQFFPRAVPKTDKYYTLGRVAVATLGWIADRVKWVRLTVVVNNICVYYSCRYWVFYVALLQCICVERVISQHRCFSACSTTAIFDLAPHTFNLVPNLEAHTESYK